MISNLARAFHSIPFEVHTHTHTHDIQQVYFLCILVSIRTLSERNSLAIAVVDFVDVVVVVVVIVVVVVVIIFNAIWHVRTIWPACVYFVHTSWILTMLNIFIVIVSNIH